MMANVIVDIIPNINIFIFVKRRGFYSFLFRKSCYTNHVFYDDACDELSVLTHHHSEGFIF